jgi:hypothetical protein
LRNIIFASKSYDRKGKIHESIEHHNRDVADHFRREKFDKMKEDPIHSLGVQITFSGLTSPETGRSIVSGVALFRALGLKGIPMSTTWALI